MPHSTLISPAELAAHLDDPDWIVMDCRFSLGDTTAGRSAYAESHIRGACYAHLDEDLSGPIIPGKSGRHPLPEIPGFASRLGGWGIARHTQVVAYDDMGGPFAARLWWMLRWLGHEAAAVLDGGWTAWLEAGYPIDDKPCARQPRVFQPRPIADMLVSTHEVSASIDDSDVTLVDARARERYEGRHEPIDPVAGHIPSAICFPWSENLDDRKNFLPAEALRTRFAGIAGSSDLLCYCGSGVTAAHNVLAIAHAGYPMPRLYAGSWSEWITDPSRPIEVENDQVR